MTNPPPKKDKPARLAWIKSLNPQEMEEHLESEDEHKVWVQSRTPEQMAQWLERAAERMEAKAVIHAREAFASNSDEDIWFAAAVRKKVALARVNARRCREGKRLIHRMEDDK